MLKSPLGAYADWNTLVDKSDTAAVTLVLSKHMADDVIVHGFPGGDVKGLEDACARQVQFGAAFPDLQFRVLKAGYVDGDDNSTFILYEATVILSAAKRRGCGIAEAPRDKARHTSTIPTSLTHLCSPSRSLVARAHTRAPASACRQERASRSSARRRRQ